MNLIAISTPSREVETMSNLVTMTPTESAPVPHRQPSIELLNLLDDELSPNSQRAYISDVRCWSEWLKRRGLLNGSMPEPEAVYRATIDGVVVAEYINDHQHTLKPATLSRRVAAIAKLHDKAEQRGLTNHHPTRSQLVKAALVGVRKNHARAAVAAGSPPIKKAPALLAGDLSEIIRAIDLTDLKGLRDAALLTLGWACELRRSEIAALTVADIDDDGTNAAITVRISKTDQMGEGKTKSLKASKGLDLLRVWLRVSGISSGPIFRKITRYGTLMPEGISGQTVGRIVAERAAAAGLAHKGFSGHSLRAGGISQGNIEGISDTDGMRQSGHKNHTVFSGYLRDLNPHAHRTVVFQG
jgi:integrase